jgi:DNA repair protein RecN (Recombination protein N)
MLRLLAIENYALIRKLNISFDEGFSVITGETGAGKSIILGALGLILGERADTAVLMDKENKCIVEGTFSIAQLGLQAFFTNNDIDYDDVTIIRREINPAGKSRAFINDTPINLNLLRNFGELLIDIHSQHENLLVKNSNFQLEVLDNLADNKVFLERYANSYQVYHLLLTALEQLLERERQSRLDEDYYRFLLSELDQAHLEPNEHETLEMEVNMLTHAEDIKTALLKSAFILNQAEPNILEGLSETVNTLQAFSEYMPEIEELLTRLHSTYVELKDLTQGIEKLESKVIFDPQVLEEARRRLDLLFSLEKKHRVQSTAELLKIQDDLQEKIAGITNLSETIVQKQKEALSQKNALDSLADTLHERRIAVCDDFEKQAVSILKRLGMPDAAFKVKINLKEEIGATGKDQVRFLFNANKGGEPGEIAKIASGGELSRVMLAIKSLVSNKLLLPTIIFDEIDLGISGKVADMAGNILSEVSKGRQVIAITHLPQIAGKGENHYFVYKQYDTNRSLTGIRLLNKEERVNEIANMMSGENVSHSAIEAAKELLSTIRK